MIARFEGKYDFLSNFHPAKVKLRGELYDTVEAAYQAAKFLDEDRRAQIRACKYPGQAKKLARSWKEHARDNWKEINLKVMKELLRAKFAAPELRAALLATGDEELQEGNWWGDDFFGVVISHAGKSCKPYGQNHLGRLLMEVRAECRAGEAQTAETSKASCQEALGMTYERIA